MGIPDNLTCLLWNRSAGQEETVRTRHGTMDWFQIRKGVYCQDYILSPCLFNLYTENIIWNAWLDEVQAGIKIVGRSINNLRFADDTTLIAESEEELKEPLDEGERGEWKSWFKTQHSRRSQDGGGIGRGDHFLSYKFTERTIERWTKFTKQLLIASSGHQAPRKAAHCLRREVGQKY